MNTIVRTHYPAELLPEELRPEGIEGRLVTVTVTVEERPERVPSLEEIFASLPPSTRSAEDIIDALRRQRDEWDD